MYYWKYEIKRALGVQEGEWISLHGINGPWERVVYNSKSEFLSTGKAQIRTLGWRCHSLRWNEPVMVRTRSWTPLIMGLLVGLSLMPLFAALATRPRQPQVVTTK